MTHMPTSHSNLMTTVSKNKSQLASSNSGIQTFTRLLPMIGLLWGFFLLRAHMIDVHMAYFIDELNHVSRAQVVWSFSDIQISTTPSKFLLYYYIGLFDLPNYLPGWLARTPVALFAMVGAASTYTFTRMWFSRAAALTAVIVLAVFPFMIFHERMALTDPLTASIVMMSLWYSLVLARHPSKRGGLILGLMLSFMIAAKILSVPLLAMPVAVMALFGKKPLRLNQNLRQQAIELWKIYGPTLLNAALVVGVIWGIIMGFYFIHGLLYPEESRPLVDDYLYGLPDSDTVLDGNMTHVEEAFRYLWGPLLTALSFVGIIVLVWKRWREAVLLVGCILAVWLPLIFVAQRPNSRYLSVVGHLWVILAVGGMFILKDELSHLLKPTPLKFVQWTPVVLLGVWVVTFGAPFSYQNIYEPTALKLPERETHGYFRNFTGFALRDALELVETLPPISEGTDQRVIVGIIRSCPFLHYHMAEDAPIKIICPPEREVRHEVLNAALEQYGAVYMFNEQLPPPRTDLVLHRERLAGRAEWVATYHRPHGGIIVDVYIVYPGQIPVSGVRTTPDDGEMPLVK